MTDRPYCEDRDPSSRSGSENVDYFTDLMLSFVERLAAANGRPPLIVPMTLTVPRRSMSPGRLLVEFERFYDLMCGELVQTYDPDSRVPLLPFTIALHRESSWCPGTCRSRDALPFSAYDDPGLARVRPLSVIHPTLSERFLAAAGTLEETWRSVPTSLDRVNGGLAGRDRTTEASDHAERTVDLHPRLAARYRRLLADLPASRDLVRADVDRWFLTADSDIFVMLPGPTSRPRVT